MRKKTAKKTAFVPRIIFKAAALVSVVPLCACGGKTTGEEVDSGIDGPIFTVAERCFADSGCEPPPGDASDDVQFTVAMACYGDADCVPFDAREEMIVYTVAATCFDGGGPPWCHDAGDTDGGSLDARLGVAADAFADDAGPGKH